MTKELIERPESVALEIDMQRALRDPDYRWEISLELETDITDALLDDAAQALADTQKRIERYEAALTFISEYAGAAVFRVLLNEPVNRVDRIDEYARAALQEGTG